MLGLSEPGYIDIMKESGKIDRAQLHKELPLGVRTLAGEFSIRLTSEKLNISSFCSTRGVAYLTSSL